MSQSELFHHFKAYFCYSYKIHALLCQYLKTDAPILLRGKRMTPKTGHFEYEKEKELSYGFSNMFDCVASIDEIRVHWIYDISGQHIGTREDLFYKYLQDNQLFEGDRTAFKPMFYQLVQTEPLIKPGATYLRNAATYELVKAS